MRVSVLFRLWGGLLSLLLVSFTARAQSSLLRDVVVRTDTASYQLSRHTVVVQGEPTLFFWFRRDDETVELRLMPESKLPGQKPLRLRRSADFQQLDSLTLEADGTYRTRLKFQDLTSSQFIRLTVEQPAEAAGQEPWREVVPLLPVARTSVALRRSDDELYVGEEKVLELTSSNARNVRATGEWVRGDDFDYRLTREATGTLRLHILPNQLGRRTLAVKLQTERPQLQAGKLNYQLPPLRQEFTVKASRLRFLSPDKRSATLDEQSRRRGVELILDNGRSFELRRTYRLEDQEEPGGTLVAELYTRQYLSNDRVLCYLRPYNTHRQIDGYLYVKLNDQAQYVTNLDITPKTTITGVQVLHRGAEWTSSLSVNPGETVDVRLEGEGLQKARFHFEDLQILPSDSAVRTDTRAVYRVQVPVTYDKRKITIFNAGQPTGFALNVREFQRPHALDFVSVAYGESARLITRLNGPVLYDHTIRDVVFNFNPVAIDSDRQLYGKQYLSFEIRTLNSKGELVEMRNVDNVLICPGDNSPRAAFYQDKQCRTDPLSLNSILSRKTYDLDDWSRILVTVKHQAAQYSEPGYTQVVELVLKRKFKFDIDVSFPAGLLTKRQGEAGYGSFSGISLATLAQFSFYHPEKINRLRPYKIGAGFVALNAFNLTSDNNVRRDLGIVVLGSVYPTRREAKLTFPLYLGGGYFLSAQKWFYMLGPGIGVRL